MNRVPVKDLCHAASSAAARVRDVFRERSDTPEVLERFWCVQDSLDRLVEAASDYPDEVFEVLKREQPRLFQDIIDVLASTAKTRAAHNAGVSAACENINERLVKLEMLKLARATRATTATGATA